MTAGDDKMELADEQSVARLQFAIREWLAVLEDKGLESMVRKALPIIFGFEYLERHRRIRRYRSACGHILGA